MTTENPPKNVVVSVQDLAEFTIFELRREAREQGIRVLESDDEEDLAKKLITKASELGGRMQFRSEPFMSSAVGIPTVSVGVTPTRITSSLLFTMSEDDLILMAKNQEVEIPPAVRDKNALVQIIMKGIGENGGFTFPYTEAFKELIFTKVMPKYQHVEMKIIDGLSVLPVRITENTLIKYMTRLNMVDEIRNQGGRADGIEPTELLVARLMVLLQRNRNELRLFRPPFLNMLSVLRRQVLQRLETAQLARQGLPIDNVFTVALDATGRPEKLSLKQIKDKMEYIETPKDIDKYLTLFRNIKRNKHHELRDFISDNTIDKLLMRLCGKMPLSVLLEYVYKDEEIKDRLDKMNQEQKNAILQEANKYKLKKIPSFI